MTTKEAKQYLSDYKAYDRLLNELEEQLQRLKQRAAVTPEGDYSAGINGVSMQISAVSVLMAKIESWIGEVKDPLQQRILRLRYIDALSWRDVGDRMGYVPDYCIRLANKAIQRLQLKSIKYGRL